MLLCCKSHLQFASNVNWNRHWLVLRYTVIQRKKHHGVRNPIFLMNNQQGEIIKIYPSIFKKNKKTDEERKTPNGQMVLGCASTHTCQLNLQSVYEAIFMIKHAYSTVDINSTTRWIILKVSSLKEKSHTFHIYLEVIMDLYINMWSREKHAFKRYSLHIWTQVNTWHNVIIICDHMQKSIIRMWKSCLENQTSCVKTTCKNHVKTNVHDLNEMLEYDLSHVKFVCLFCKC